jgi:predicted SnoaL-like aldol condensation-catalyzing enzyme
MISPTTYLQHNPDGLDGLEGFNQFVQYLQANNIEMVYNNCYHILTEGNFTLVMTDGSYGGQAVAYYDLFRVEDNMIVEHWDVVAPIPPKTEWKNANGKF